MGAHHDRFDGLADLYERYRPGFPDAAFEALLARAPSDGPRLAVDVGAGTGLSAEGLLRATPVDWRVLALEPGADMRGRCTARLAGEKRATVAEGSAEALGVEDGAASIVLAARALHWFDLDAFFPEARRALAPGGLLAALFNRLQPSPAMGAIEAFFESEGAAETTRISRGFDVVAALAGAEGFDPPERLEIPWRVIFDAETISGVFLTRSTLRPIVERLGRAAVEARIAAILAETAPGATSYPVDYLAVLAVCRKQP